MTTTLAVDARNDIYIGGDGGLAVASGLAATMQICVHVAKAIRNEMVLNYDEGIPYFQAVWTGSPNVMVFEAALRRRLLQVPDVTDVISLSSRLQDGILSYSASIRTIYGTGQLNG